MVLPPSRLAGTNAELDGECRPSEGREMSCRGPQHSVGPDAIVGSGDEEGGWPAKRPPPNCVGSPLRNSGVRLPSDNSCRLTIVTKGRFFSILPARPVEPLTADAPTVYRTGKASHFGWPRAANARGKRRAESFRSFNARRKEPCADGGLRSAKSQIVNDTALRRRTIRRRVPGRGSNRPTSPIASCLTTATRCCQNQRPPSSRSRQPPSM